jgi:hypothetical protein
MQINKQDLKFIDFSGGITDYDMPGAPTKMRTMDNLHITSDRHVETRPGSEIHSSTTYQLGTTDPVRTLINFDEDSELLGHSAQFIYYLNPTWTSLLGPSGNEPFANNVAATQIDAAQWKSHAFFTSGVKTEPVKIYRDGSDNMQLRTAGLPEFSVSDVYTASTLLTAAIALAVQIKDRMLDHVADFGAAPALHIAEHASVDAALSALVDPTTLAELITYVGVLKTQYTAHIDDARNPYATQTYHAQLSNSDQPAFGEIKDPILNLDLDSELPDPPTTTEECITILNDIRNKYNWHTNAPITHQGADSTSAVKWGLYQVALDAIDPEAKTPVMSPNHESFIRYVNNLRGEYNLHLNTTNNRHRYLDTTLQIIAPAATTLHGAVAILALLEFYYAQHFRDANYDDIDDRFYNDGFYADNDYYVFTGDTTNGSPDIANVSPDPTDVAISPLALTGHYLARVGSSTTNPYQWDASIQPFVLTATVAAVAAGPNLIQMSVNATQTGTFAFAFAGGRAHFDVDRSAGALTSSAMAARNFLENVDLTLEDLDSLALAVEAFAAKLKAHEIGSFDELSNTELAETNQYANPAFTYYALPDSDSFTAKHYIPHSGLIGSIYFPQLALTDAPDSGQGYFEAGLDVGSFLYKFVYRYDYTVGQEDHIDFGTPSESISVSTFISPESLVAGDTDAEDPVEISSIPVLANTSTQNWDTANIKVEVHRTTNGGTVFRKLGELTNGTTTFTDSILDAENTGELLYTTGGVVGNDQPPKAKYIEILNGIALYGNYDEGSESFPNRVRQSILNDPDSCPADFYDEFDEEVTGIGSTRSNFVVFCSNSTYREEGSFDEQGRGFLRHERISDSIGCINHASIVKTDVGLFFAGNNGFYYTDGYQVMRVSSEIEPTYLSYTAGATQKSSLVGTYDKLQRRVLWTMKSTEAAAAPDKIYVFDLNWGIKQDGAFTSWSGNSLSPTALCFFGGYIIRGHKDGYIFRHKDSLYFDPKVNTAVAATSWTVETLRWSLKTTHSDYGSAFLRKYATQLFLEAKQITNVSIQPTTNVDKGRKVDDLRPIRSRKLLDWGDPNMQWTTEFTASAGETIDQRRRFAAGSLRGNYLSIEMGNAYTVVIGSDTLGVADITKTGAETYRATLDSVTYNWPTYSEDYYIRLAGTDYLITSRVSDKVIEFTDPTDTLAAPQANVEWELWGYPKNEKLNLVGFHVAFLPLGQQQHAYQGATSVDGGENA